MREDNGNFYKMVPDDGGRESPEVTAHYSMVPGDEKTTPNGDIVIDNTVRLQKRVGLVSGVALIVGTMIGSGIFISPKGVLAGTGSVALSLIVWAGCGLIALFGALSYAELGTMITKSGAEYAYIGEASKWMPKWLAPIPSFLFAWVSVFIIKPSLFAIISMSFAVYMVEIFFPDCPAPPHLHKIISSLCILLITFINCYSVKLATKVQNVFTVVKLVAVAVITVGGFLMIVKGNTQFLSEGFDDTERSPSTIALAFYDGLWAYDGWNNLNYVTEELINPYVNLPRAIIIGIPLVTICYLLTNISYLAVISRAEILVSDAVGALWAERVLGAAAIIIPIAVMFSTVGAANGTCFTGGRLVYAAAREGHLPGILSYVHVKQFTPLPSLIFTTLISLLMVFCGDIFTMIDFFSFVAWLFYGATFASVIVLRFTKPDVYRPYKVPIWIPVVTLLISVYLVIAPIVQHPRIEFLYAALFVLSGLIFYVPFVHFQVRIPFMDGITRCLQLMVDCAPSKYQPAE